MRSALAGLLWALAYVLLEATQFVFFGGLFQRLSAFLFGFLVFGVIAVVFIGWAAVTRPEEIRAAAAVPHTLIAINVCVTLAVGAYLLSVQLIEPAVTYTLSAGVMPLTAYLAHRLEAAEGEPMRNRTEALGNLLLLAGVVYLSAVTLLGYTGFVRGGPGAAAAGVALALVDGVLFTWVLIYGQRLNRSGTGPGAVFGLRFPLYVGLAGLFALSGADDKGPVTAGELTLLTLAGLALTVPPLYALQRAVEQISTLTLSALTALGPFVIFALQQIEGRVAYSSATLAGLALYSAGALLAALGAVRATVHE